MSEDKKKVAGIGMIAIEAILAGKTNEQALEAVSKAHPGANTGMASINWYRNKLRAEGAKLKGSSKPVPTSRELAAAAKKVNDAAPKKAEKKTPKKADPLA
jgi:hypothetical protein